MEVRVGPTLLGLEDEPLLHPETQQPWTVGSVLATVALGAPPPGTSYTETEQTARYMLAMDIRDALRLVRDGLIDSAVDIPPEMLIKLKADIVRSFGPIIAGQMVPLLNGTRPLRRRRPLDIELIEAERPD